MIRFLYIQTKNILEKKFTIAIYFGLLGCVLFHFIGNVLLYRGRDALNMYHPMELVLMTGENFISYYILQFFPFLVVLAGGWSYFDDHASGMETFWVSKKGAKTYYVSKITATFLAVFLVFLIPFLIEIVLNAIAFPHDATGNIWNWSVYDSSYTGLKEELMWSQLYSTSRYVYVLCRAVLLSASAGILAAFTVSLSFLRIFRYRVLLFLPPYLLLFLTGYAGRAILGNESEYSTDYMDYLLFYLPIGGKTSVPGMLLYLSAIILISVGLTVYRIRRDVINK